jgi:hypothetical protein
MCSDNELARRRAPKAKRTLEAPEQRAHLKCRVSIDRSTELEPLSSTS